TWTLPTPTGTSFGRPPDIYDADALQCAEFMVLRASAPCASIFCDDIAHLQPGSWCRHRHAVTRRPGRCRSWFSGWLCGLSSDRRASTGCGTLISVDHLLAAFNSRRLRIRLVCAPRV